jgi:alkanesulfonate monooxygenase SsuD/methylene tetrahydromethanopterin reductase-like flavin-dependent oxidoreductase (luciferase family)
MVDVLSNGRFRMGVGLGHFDPEFELFGVNPKTQVSRFEESLDLIERAWAGEEIDHEGKHFKVKGGPVTPSPVAAEVWLGATSEPGVKRAARRGKPWITDYLHNIDVIDRWAKIYRAAAAENGSPEKARVCMLRQGWVGDSLEDVERVWWPNMRQDNWFYFSQIPRYVADLEPWVASIEKEEDFVFERHLVDRMIVGSPDECIASLRKFERVIDPEYMIMTFRAAEGPSFEDELTCIRRFGAEVIPAFGS